MSKSLIDIGNRLQHHILEDEKLVNIDVDVIASCRVLPTIIIAMIEGIPGCGTNVTIEQLPSDAAVQIIARWACKDSGDETTEHNVVFIRTTKWNYKAVRSIARLVNRDDWEGLLRYLFDIRDKTDDCTQ